MHSVINFIENSLLIKGLLEEVFREKYELQEKFL